MNNPGAIHGMDEETLEAVLEAEYRRGWEACRQDTFGFLMGEALDLRETELVIQAGDHTVETGERQMHRVIRGLAHMINARNP